MSPMWCRLVTCGRLSIGLLTWLVTNRPHDAILPDVFV